MSFDPYLMFARTVVTPSPATSEIFGGELFVDADGRHARERAGARRPG